MNIFITGVPLALFVLFTITVLIFSLIVGLVLGLLAAVVFTLFCVGVALTIVLPFIFFTTMTACFLFLWGLGGYYILKWANNRGDTAEEKPLLSSGSIGDSINNLTGGKLSGFMDSAKKERSKGDISGYNDENTEPNAAEKKDGQKGHANGGPQQPQQQQKSQKQSVGGSALSPQQPSSTAHKATKATGVESSAKKSANATSAVKAGVGGVTGLS